MLSFAKLCEVGLGAAKGDAGGGTGEDEGVLYAACPCDGGALRVEVGVEGGGDM